ncbi:MAG: hypothetical protein D3920_07910 [Candidatus Electrothrix sp. AW2]|jgi:hypothetical protein|nr:hypothetical protein [Candidatus Electrothrix gigas]MCI5134982.1 hypothetical protein [Candidatus Electrothrix gigas]MCI5180723.1 hypothetical protein [Candidatus Electrothrix gigas]MCI5188647.1 hypothetical protein [Candidatus Electrothrix gigas]MCI5225852.1 hypothetical protein [Candidatus Electrothrix gigas]
MTTGYTDGEYPHEIQKIFDEIEQALAGAVGPAARMILDEYIKQWQQDGPIVATRIIELTTALVEEIGDPETAQEFISRIEKNVN